MVKDSTIQQPAAAEEKSNLTCASGEATASVSYINRIDSSTGILYPQHNLPLLNQPQVPPKKKRNQPGHPDPDAEVVALSPRTLMATNRFVCEICSKGFQRDQNLQLHRRGHNLPWKLKQRANKQKVYVCPETSCVHHDPSRALGDLTGIKKHFSRKHGEKKWKCEKCSKRYAVQSDFKAHSKTCGTKEYICDCGTIFTRRDSFITHRAFCDALVHESTRSILTTNNTINPLESNVNVTSHHINLHQLQPQFNPIPIKKEQPNFSSEIPTWLSSPPIIGPGPQPIDLTTSSSSFVFQYFQQNHDDHFSQDDQNPNPNQTPICTSTLPPYNHHPSHLSATALLQRASHEQMGAKSSTVSCGEFISTRPHQTSHVSGFGVNLSSRDEFMNLACYGNKAAAVTGGGGSTETAGHVSELGRTTTSTNSPNLFHDMMMMDGFDQGSSFDDIAFDGILTHASKKSDENFHAHQFSSKSRGGMTSDFLGLSQSDDILLDLNNCLGHCNENQNQNAWQD